MRPFTLLVKPTSADCNLRCRYCFYLEKCNLYPDATRHRMTDTVLEQMIKTYMATEQPSYSFGWQGGEPTLMGVDFFRRMTALQQKYGRAGSSVANGLQTNATLIDDEFAAHLAKFKFLVGCSLDGPARMHDHYRRTIGGEATHAAVMHGIETLKRHEVEFNILVLVSQANVKHPRRVYRYLLERGFMFHQYIPCVEFDPQGNLMPFAISGQEWGNFMCGIFDEWYPKDAHTVSIRQFDSYLMKQVDSVVTTCTLGRNCCQYFVIEHNGDIYPCDFFVEKPLRVGNVMDTSWPAAQNSPVYQQFGAMKARWSATCETCDCLDLCSGDCLKHRIYGSNTPEQLSHLCTGWKQLIAHARPGLKTLGDEVRARRAQHAQILKPHLDVPQRTQAPAGRNDPCPCGSGLKYKKCCGR